VLKEDEILKDDYGKVNILCPRCKSEKTLQIPKKIASVSEHLITISIPAGFVCKHSFQVFMDKNFHVRAYQNADFEISNIEYYENRPRTEEDLVTYTSSILMKNIIIILREALISKVILGGALFKINGKVIYSSLPDNIFLDMMKQFEIKKEENDQEIKLKKIIFVLNDNKKVFSEYITIKQMELILILFFSSEITLNDGESYLRKIVRNFLDVENIKPKVVKIEAKKEPSPYWVFSKISKDVLIQSADTIFIDSLGFKVSRSVILNLKDIIHSNNEKHFEGKIFFTEKYVKLMEGLALTLKDAAVFIRKLNKMP
jgi:hypothetical protein